MKNIIVTQRLILNDSYYELREALDIKWGSLFEQLDILPIVLPMEYDFKKYFNNIQIDGILLTGGNDLNSLNKSTESLKRDNFEKELIDYGIKHNIPIFGMCRGMQIIAEYFRCSFKKVEDQVAIKHTIKVNKQSKYFDLLEKIDKVNSFHNFAVDNITDELIVSARNEKNMIKAIEHKQYKIFGQMWHSEREKPFNSGEINMIREFFND